MLPFSISFYGHLLPNGETFLFHQTVQTAMARHKSRRRSRSDGDGLFGMRVPPGGRAGGPAGLDWFLNSMEHALIASQRAESVLPFLSSVALLMAHTRLLLMSGLQARRTVYPLPLRYGRTRARFRRGIRPRRRLAHRWSSSSHPSQRSADKRSASGRSRSSPAST